MTVGAVPAPVAAPITQVELGPQIRAALEQLPSAATATIRVQHGNGIERALAVAEVWTITTVDGAARRVCDLPAAVGLRMGVVEQALDEAGVFYPRVDLGLRARWRRLTGIDGEIPGFELVISMPDCHRGQTPAGPQDTTRMAQADAPTPFVAQTAGTRPSVCPVQERG